MLNAVDDKDVEPIYDAILIDEAQDLPIPFFRLVYKFTKNPKRIMWAYDELQNLTDAAMPSVADLFGQHQNGRPYISLENTEGQPRADITLPICYRNTPWALTVAHALGFGTERRSGVVQHFDDPVLWRDIGYDVMDGELTLGSHVRLRRGPNSYPPFFRDLIQPADAVSVSVFDSEDEQAEWVAESIRKNLQEDELEPDDILVILPETVTAKKKAFAIINALGRNGIEAHLAGVTQSEDELFVSGSVAISHIFRAKGNEAPMVYVLNCNYCNSGYELIKLRNILFTAITRSRAWVRLCGVGGEMRQLQGEINRVIGNSYELDFTIPDEQHLTRLRRIHRDRSKAELERYKRLEKGAKEIVAAMTAGDLSPDSLPPQLRSQLLELLSRGSEDNEEDA